MVIIFKIKGFVLKKEYFIIGDVHGYASNLKKLLLKLGFELINNAFIHPEKKKAVFVGDYIDRGQEEEKVIDIVRSMVKADSAIALMGNHEFNAICYATKGENGYIRKHTEKNTHQHQAFLDEYPFGTEKHRDAIEWFKTLPIYFEDEGLRVIHAAWVTSHVEKIKPHLGNNNTLTNKLIQEFEEKGWVYETLETLLKGVEYELPDGMTWTDRDGVERNTMRYNWFKTVENVTYKNCALSIPDYVELPDSAIKNGEDPYDEDPVVFFGHYWMTGNPSIQTEKTACVDYSVAKGGELVCYHWQGENVLNNENFIL